MKSALIATDFSTASQSAWQRAASIARETGTGGALMHVLPASLPPDLHLKAASQAQEALALVAGQLKREGLGFDSLLASGEVAAELTRAARQHDLMVAGARGESILLDFSLGRTSTRLVRQCERPVLVVKRTPDGPYRRVVAAVDFSEASLAAATFGRQIAPKAQFALAHAYEVEFESTLRRGGTREDTIREYRQQAHDKAMAAMSAFAARLAPGAQARPTVARGYASRVILDCAQAEGAQLIVLGKHAAGVLERTLVGSVSLRVLETADCDVLIVPERAA